MRRSLPAALLAVGLLAGCGSQTKTVTVASAPTSEGTTGTTGPSTASTASPPPAASTTATPGSTSTSTSATRTAPEPSFTESESRPEGAAAAAAVVRARGYTPNDTSEYHPGQTLRVLVGTRSGSGDGYGQQAFFFVDGRYLGTDTKEPSAKLKVVSQSDTEVAIAYPLYRSSDPLCCPGGGQRIVHFALNDGQLTALEPIPPANSTTGLSRN
ncbi:MAG: LppP/LprE family lipoprotein [Solirubrobacteraceae bacterium]